MERSLRIGVILMAAAICLVTAVYYGSQYQQALGVVYLALFSIVPGVGGVYLLYCALRVSRELQRSLVLLVLTSWITLLAANLALAFGPFSSAGPGIGDARHSYAASQGLVPDDRSASQVLDSLRQSGLIAHRSVDRANLFNSGSGMSRSLLPLGGWSRSYTVLCNETGSWITYLSDEKGFNNPQGLWHAGSTDILAIGDSYVEGHCVSPEATLVANLRSRVPRTIGTGMAGYGPLFDLAAASEFVPELKPRVVLWFYYEGNDFSDLEREKHDSVLLSYLSRGFRQSGLACQPCVDSVLATLLVGNRIRMGPPRTTKQQGERSAVRMAKRFATLYDVRALMGLVNPYETNCCDFDYFTRALAMARDVADSSGATLHFVYLPSRQRFFTRLPWQRSLEVLARDRVLQTVNELGINVIDLLPVFEAHDHPTDLYLHRLSHYSEEGTALVAEVVLSAIRDDLVGRQPTHP